MESKSNNPGDEGAQPRDVPPNGEVPQVINLTEFDLWKAREVVALRRPFLAIALYALEPRPMPGLKTLAVSDKLDLYYDPSLEWKDEQLEAVLYHEVSHVILDHANRLKSTLHNKEFIRAHGLPDLTKDHLARKSINNLWNVAADCEINDDIEDEGGWQLPGDYLTGTKLTPPADRGQTAEHYFGHLLANATKIEVHSPGCGSCCGNPQEAEAEAEGHLSDAEKEAKLQRAEQIRQAVAEEIERRAQTHREAEAKIYRGRLAGRSNETNTWVTWAKRRIRTSKSWKRILSNTIKRNIGRTSGQVDYTMSRHSRRSPPGILLPGLLKPHPRICVVHDISGSMEGEPTFISLNAIDEIINATGVDDLIVIPTNHAAGEPIRVRKAKYAKIAFGGGTDMGQGLYAAKELRPLPDIVVVITDGETPWPSSNVFPFPIICALVEEVESHYGRPDDPPHWMKTLSIYI